MLLFLSAITIGVNTLCAFDLYKDFAMKLPMYDDSDQFFNVFGLALPVIGACGRLGWGIVGEHIPFWVLLVFGNGASAFLQILMFFTRRSRETYVLVCALLAVLPGMMNIIPVIAKRCLGSRNLVLNFGLILTGELVGCAWYLVTVSIIKNIPDVGMVSILSIPAVMALLANIAFLGSY